MNSDNPTRDIISAVTSGVQSVAETLAKTAQPYLKQSGVSGYSSAVGSHSSGLYKNTGGAEYAPTPVWRPPTLDQSGALPPALNMSSARAVVNDLCLVNAARTTPTQQALDTFVSKCESNDGTSLGQAIVAKLSEPQTPWIHKMKILCGIESLHAAGLDAVTATLRDEGTAVLFGLFSSPQCGTKARHVCALLGLIDGAGSVTASVTNHKPPTDDLLDLGGSKNPMDDLLIDSGPSIATNDLLDFGDQPSSTSVTPSPGINDSLI